MYFKKNIISFKKYNLILTVLNGTFLAHPLGGCKFFCFNAFLNVKTQKGFFMGILLFFY